MEPSNNFLLNAHKRKILGSKILYEVVQFVYREIRESIAILKLILASRKPFEGNSETNIIISLTSFPARIKYAWIPIETMFLQDTSFWKVVLVLSEEEFPDRQLPYRIRQQQMRGLEILWTQQNYRSYKKLLPTREAYPDAVIVTIDDDIFYEPQMLSKLLAASQKYPDAIIGYRGWIVTSDKNGLRPYIEWPEATPDTPPNQVFLTNGAGTLFKPDLLPNELLLDWQLASQLCPTGDDIWFWAVAKKAGVPLYCLGNHHLHCVRRQKSTPALETINRLGGQNDMQLRSVCNYFNFY